MFKLTEQNLNEQLDNIKNLCHSHSVAVICETQLPYAKVYIAATKLGLQAHGIPNELGVYDNNHVLIAQKQHYNMLVRCFK